LTSPGELEKMKHIASSIDRDRASAARGTAASGWMVASVLVLAGCNVGLSSASVSGPELGAEAAVNLDAGAEGSPPLIVMPAPDAGSVEATAVPDSGLNKYSPLCNVDELSGCDPDEPACLYDATNAGPDSGVCARGAPCDQPDAGLPVLTAACRVVVGSSKPPQTPLCSTAIGTGIQGGRCTNSADCAVGYECIEGAVGAVVGICKHYCCAGDSSCTGSNAFCDIEPVFHGINLVPVCTLGNACVPFSPCGGGETCTLVNEATGQTACVTPGPATVGQACTTEKCAANLACISNTCQQLCKLSETGAGQCPSNQTCIPSSLFGAYSSVGLCSVGS